MTDTPDWDALYAGNDAIWSGNPNGALVAELSDVPPGRALDVGCGEGADAVWLALRGWQVTALDVAAPALQRARAAADQAGADVRWLHAGLLEAPLKSEGYDLVSGQYLALPKVDAEAAVARLLSLVAPRGTLLVVHHADAGHAEDHDGEQHGFSPSDYVSLDDVRAALDDRWVVEIDETRPRSVTSGRGAHHVDDVVVKARRLD